MDRNVSNSLQPPSNSSALARTNDILAFSVKNTNTSDFNEKISIKRSNSVPNASCYHSLIKQTIRGKH